MGLCSETIRRQADQGKLPFLKVGSKRLFHIPTVMKAMMMLKKKTQRKMQEEKRKKQEMERRMQIQLRLVWRIQRDQR